MEVRWRTSTPPACSPRRRADRHGIDVVRLGYCDLIGTDRGRDLLVNRFARTVGGGVAFCRSVYGTSPRGDVIDMAGGLSDGLPGPARLPGRVDDAAGAVGAGRRALHRRPVQPGRHARRRRARGRCCVRSCERFAELGMRPIVGPELEFYVLEESDDVAKSGWQRYGEGTGNVYVSGLKGDPENVLLTALRQLGDYGIDVVAANHEFSSGQFEINLWHSDALDAADRAHRFKAAVKELSRSPGQARDLHAQAVQRRGRLRLPPALLHPDRRRRAGVRRPDGARTACRRSPIRRSPASSPTPRRWPRCPTRRSTPTSGSARTPWRRG